MTWLVSGTSRTARPQARRVACVGLIGPDMKTLVRYVRRSPQFSRPNEERQAAAVTTSATAPRETRMFCG